jgi:hypothetical protein
MNRLWMGSAARIGVCGVAIAAAGESCQSVAPPAGPATPVNTCPEHPCTAYTAAGGAPASCVDGACAVPQSASSLVMVIGLSQDSGFAPARTFAVLYDQLVASQASPAPSPACDAGGCDALPNVATPSGQYVVAPSVAQPFPLGVGWNLGNTSYTGLPVQVTYRLQWQASASSTATVDAQSLGLPVPPVQAVTSYNRLINIPPPASTGLGGILYQTYLQAGVYERIMTPTAPFNQAFPPSVEVLPVVPGADPDQSQVTLDSTTLTTGMPTIPAFDITSFAGPMDGWTAYLRDNTGLTVSNVVALQGTESRQVVLATAHVAPKVDALLNTTLVIAPPEGTPMPTEVFTANVPQLPAAESYPALPAPVAVTGTVTTTGGAAAPAQIVFEALAITVTSSQGTNVPNTSNFEFTGYANAELDTSGTASYSVVLPQGTYRASVRPLTTANQVTIVDPVVIDGTASTPGGGPNFTVDVPRSAQGTALVADGRPLAGATVDLLPVGCGVLDDGGANDGTSTWCLPRPVQAPTGNDGSFQLSVDPGAFLLRVKPADGSRLPWMVQTFSIAPNSPPMVIPPVNVPAPTPVGLSLYDPGGNALIHAVVRAFWLPNAGSAIELGNAITDVDGHYDMYLALPSQ